VQSYVRSTYHSVSHITKCDLDAYLDGVRREANTETGHACITKRRVYW